MFCGSSDGRGRVYLDAARTLGRLISRRGDVLVYGGAAVGVMGAVADASLDAGGRVVGVIPRQLVEREIAHPRLTTLHVVADMHERKAMMAANADAFIAMPGGAGTLEELFEIWTWAQLGLHAKPIGLLDVNGYYEPLRAMIDHMTTEGFLQERHSRALLIDSDAERLLDRFADYRAPGPKWAPHEAAEAADLFGITEK
ncbi:putative TIGR00730 family protein [Actinoalloteichus sp. GBA129-24]|uniref:Cytokinin riboside 5'-monophosphate phosphoribohydrolase n=1 Tax=Actinoalloteichus fjordicus TaxID=1612552 RepID=A0AAC9PQR5_9PSEU|nr:putative TIGR00730 family protein [Actinoalloteichus fjordicus]APU19393.1 putative TIGR00730 family protein [Actinoalloteichus sp. GBA129-24]